MKWIFKTKFNLEFFILVGIKDIHENPINLTNRLHREAKRCKQTKIDFGKFLSRPNIDLALRNFFGRILEDVGKKQGEATQIMCDSKSSIAVAKNHVFQSKHIALKHHFIREAVEENVIEV